MAQAPRLILDVSKIGDLDPTKEGTKVSLPKTASQLGDTAQSAIRSAVTGPLKIAIPKAEEIASAFRLSDAGSCDVSLLGAAKGFPLIGVVHDVTAALGLDVTGAIPMTYSVGGGLYASTTREWGTYKQAAGGVTTNVSFFAGVQFTFIFGPPSDLAGDAWAVGVDASLPPPSVLGGGGVLLFATSLPIRLIGFAVQGGYSAGLPFDVTIQFSRTVTSKHGTL